MSTFVRILAACIFLLKDGSSLSDRPPLNGTQLLTQLHSDSDEVNQHKVSLKQFCCLKNNNTHGQFTSCFFAKYLFFGNCQLAGTI